LTILRRKKEQFLLVVYGNSEKQIKEKNKRRNSIRKYLRILGLYFRSVYLNEKGLRGLKRKKTRLFDEKKNDFSTVQIFQKKAPDILVTSISPFHPTTRLSNEEI